MQRLRQRSFDVPTTLEPHFHSVTTEPKLLTQFGKARRISKSGEHSIIAAVSVLLRSGGPLAVARLVIAVVVLAFNRKAGRAFAHVFNKRFKLIPSFADRYSSPSIIGMIIPTPRKHLYPNSMCSEQCWSSVRSRRSMRCHPGPQPVHLQASTRFGVPHQQRIIRDIKQNPAITSAETFGRTTLRLKWADNDPSCKSSSGQDSFLGRHNNDSSVVVFSSGRTASTVRPLRFSQLLTGGQGD